MNKKSVSDVVSCMVQHSTYVNTTLNPYWPIYRNSRYRAVRHWSINS